MTYGEIDALVAEHIDGWRWVVDDESPYRFLAPVDHKPTWWSFAKGTEPIGKVHSTPTIPRYSTDPAASKALRDKMRAEGYGYTIDFAPDNSGTPLIMRASFHRSHEDELWWADADAEERAVSIAALRAKGIEVDG